MPNLEDIIQEIINRLSQIERRIAKTEVVEYVTSSGVGSSDTHELMERIINS